MGIRSHKYIGMFVPSESDINEELEAIHDRINDCDEFIIPSHVLDIINGWSPEKRLAFFGPKIKEPIINIENVFHSAYVVDDTFGFFLTTPFQESLNMYSHEYVDKTTPGISMGLQKVVTLPHYDASSPDKCSYGLNPEFYEVILESMNLPKDFISYFYPASIITWG